MRVWQQRATQARGCRWRLDFGGRTAGGDGQGGEGADQQDAQTHPQDQLQDTGHTYQPHFLWTLIYQRMFWVCLGHLSYDAVLLDLSKDESGADEADEAAHGRSSQTQDGFN